MLFFILPVKQQSFSVVYKEGFVSRLANRETFLHQFSHKNRDINLSDDKILVCRQENVEKRYVFCPCTVIWVGLTFNGKILK